jgi:bifunctional DNA-binding transcriptional regulator/antitoxin component of YhaV-PrlF toxin-antitoxin module
MQQSKGLTKGLSKVWMTNKVSATLIIPIDIAKKYELNESSHVIVEERPDLNGILIRKLEL